MAYCREERQKRTVLNIAQLGSHVGHQTGQDPNNHSVVWLKL